MPINLNTGKRIKPRRVLLYGPHGTGKSTWATRSPSHILLNFEDGVNDIDCTSTDRITTLAELTTILMELATDAIEFDWLIFDTLDWLETLIHDAVRGDHDSIADIGYGAGYKKALAQWQIIIKAAEYLMKAKGCGIIGLAHSAAKRFDPPDADSYDRYEPALHPLASLLWQEWCDEVLHLNYRPAMTRTEDVGFSQKRTIVANDQAERFIRTQESPAVVAKSRLTLPVEIPCEWSVYQQAITDSQPKPTKKAK